MPTTTNIYSIALRLLPNTPFAVSVSADNKRQEKPPVLMRGVPAILRIRLFKDGEQVTAEELAAEYSSFRLVVAQDFDENTDPILVSDETGATIDAENDLLVLPMTSMNTETLEALIGTRERLDLGAELQLFKPTVQDEPIEAWQFPVGVQNRRDLTGTATPAPGSVNYYDKDETDDLLAGKADLVDGKVPSSQLPIATKTTLGAVRVWNTDIGNTAGPYMTSNGVLDLRPADPSYITNRQSHCPITPGRLNYAVIAALTDANHIELSDSQAATARAVLGMSSAITTIPAATSAYSLLDATATTNNHSWQYKHAPTSAPTYTLPAVTDATVVHSIDLKVKFSAGVLTYSFLDSAGNAVTPLAQPEIAAGTVVDFLCEYDPLSSQWVVMPLVMVEGGAA